MWCKSPLGGGYAKGMPKSLLHLGMRPVCPSSPFWQLVLGGSSQYDVTRTFIKLSCCDTCHRNNLRCWKARIIQEAVCAPVQVVCQCFHCHACTGRHWTTPQLSGMKDSQPAGHWPIDRSGRNDATWLTSIPKANVIVSTCSLGGVHVYNLKNTHRLWQT